MANSDLVPGYQDAIDTFTPLLTKLVSALNETHEHEDAHPLMVNSLRWRMRSYGDVIAMLTVKRNAAMGVPNEDQAALRTQYHAVLDLAGTLFMKQNDAASEEEWNKLGKELEAAERRADDLMFQMALDVDAPRK